MLEFLLWSLVLGGLAWWFVSRWRARLDARGAESGDDVSRAWSDPHEDDLLYRWLRRVPKVFTQPHLLPAHLQGGAPVASGSSAGRPRPSSGAGPANRAGEGGRAGDPADPAEPTGSGDEASVETAVRTPRADARRSNDRRESRTGGGGHRGRAAKRPLFDAPPERDDLKRISGIGPVMERMLNELGVVSFAQLASFDRADVERVDAALENFRGRIERDDWVGQAKSLLATRKE